MSSPSGVRACPGRQRILGIFQGLRILLVETMHYGTNQKFGGPGQDLGGLCPSGPNLKPPLVCCMSSDGFVEDDDSQLISYLAADRVI